MEIIRTAGLTKHYGATRALEQISIHIQEGEIYGFLGLNGAGKTTLIRCLLGMIKPDAGEICLFGKTLKTSFRDWNAIGYLVETPHSYPNLTVYENLRVFQQLRQLPNRVPIDQILTELKLDRYRHTRARALSLGNQQRLGLAKALLHRPRLLILDEPINGLDPNGIVEVRELLLALAAGGSTIFLSSHILGEISRLASRIGIIHEGRLLQELTSTQLNNQLIQQILIQTHNNTTARNLLSEAGYEVCTTDNDCLAITNAEAFAHPEDITQYLCDRGLPPRQVYHYAEDLESYFLRTLKEQAS